MPKFEISLVKAMAEAIEEKNAHDLEKLREELCLIVRRINERIDRNKNQSISSLLLRKSKRTDSK